MCSFITISPVLFSVWRIPKHLLLLLFLQHMTVLLLHLREESMHDPSTFRSDFCLWWTIEMSSSQSGLESYKTWDFRVGNSSHNYLDNPCNQENS